MLSLRVTVVDERQDESRHLKEVRALKQASTLILRSLRFKRNDNSSRLLSLLEDG
jgi:hypothetical protein